MRWNRGFAIIFGAMLTLSLAGQQSSTSATEAGGTVVERSTAAVDSAPDLAPYTPVGWETPVVVSNVTGTHTSTVPLPSGATAYLDFAAVNQGTAPTAATYHHRIYVDDVFKKEWYTSAPQNAGAWVYVSDYSLGVLPDGLHRVRYVIDEAGVIAESNEANNVYEHYVGAGPTNLLPFQSPGSDDKIVISTQVGTGSDASSIRTSDTVFIDFAALNVGPGGASEHFLMDLYVDGLFVSRWSAPILGPNYFTWVADYSIGQFAPGGHTVRLVVDVDDRISETNEFDNEYTKTFVVSDVLTPRIYISPTTLTFGSTGSDASGVGPASHADNAGGDRGVPAHWLDPQASAKRSALRAKALKHGSVRVIARLDASFVPEGRLSALGIEKQRRDIRARQERAARALGVAESRLKKFDTIPFFAAEVDANQFERLEKLPEVIEIVEDSAAEPDMASSNPVVRSPVAWAAGFDGSGQVVAVLDTGVSATHPYFATGPNKIVAEACYSSTTSVSTSLCPGGVSASTLPGAGSNCPDSVFGCHHGTHVAGTAAGNDWTGPNFGVGRGADVVAIQVFSRFSSESDCGVGLAPCALSFASDQIRALERVLALYGTLPIASVNMSLGWGHYTSRAVCDSEQAALKAAIDNLASVEIATIAAAGNSGYLDATGVPACISSAVAVSATTDADLLPVFSNVASWVYLVAPGVNITSSVPGGGAAENSGTSMAAPHVAGAWAIMKQAYPGLTLSRILNALRDSAISIPDTRDFALMKDLRRLDIGAAALGNAKGFQIRNMGGSTLNVGAITTETPAAWLTLTPAGPFTLAPDAVVQVRVSVNLAAAPLGLSVTRLLIASNDADRTPYPDGLFVVVDRDPAPAPPANVVAVSPSSSAVSVTWTGVSGATNYHVYRSSNGSTWTMVGAATGTAFVDEVVLANHAYLYKVRSYAMVESADSNKDLATTVAFTDPAITGIPVHGVHWTQLLTAVNAVRAMTGLPAAAFTAPAPAAGVSVRRQHLLDLRNALAPARTALGLPAVPYTDPTITAAVTTIKAAHITDLRSGVR